MIGLLRAFALTGGEWVIYILIAASVLSVAVMIERGLVLSKERKLLNQVKPLFSKDAVPADQAKQQLSGREGFSARILTAGLSQTQHGAEAVEEQMASAAVEERQKLERRMVILGTLGNNAVYIGLFGTVLGVIKAFHDLAQEGNSGPEVVMQGLSEALIATAVGLLVALPSVIAFNIFQKQIKDLLAETDALGRLILARMKSKVG